jgi:hypothetical protein
VRTYVYIDGFNLYYGAVEGTNLKWLDIVKLCREFLPNDTIEPVHYCTALTRDTPSDPTKSTRQQMFIRALETFPEIQVTYGSFLANKKKMPLATGITAETADPNIVTLTAGCPRSAVVLRTEEKGSDVNLPPCSWLTRSEETLKARRSCRPTQTSRFRSSSSARSWV